MCKQQGACVASCRHLEFRHKASLSSVCEKHSHHSRLEAPVILHCNTADCRSLWSSAFVSLPPPPSACVVCHLCDVSLIQYIGCVPQACTHAVVLSHTHRWGETERRRGRQQDALFILRRLWSYLFSEYVFHFIIPFWFLSIFHFGLSSAASQK